jgi:hypothetical protein
VRGIGKAAGAAIVAALPQAAPASPVLSVAADGRARVVDDRLLPPRSPTHASPATG